MTTDTPRTDAYELALLQFGIAPQEAETDNNGPILSMNRHARTLEREVVRLKQEAISKLEESVAASIAECQRLREAIERCLYSMRAECDTQGNRWVARGPGSLYREAIRLGYDAARQEQEK